MRSDWAAESTMTAILGRMATYSGKVVKWDDGDQLATRSDAEESYAWDAETLLKPRPDETYACAVPGVTRAMVVAANEASIGRKEPYHAFSWSTWLSH